MISIIIPAYNSRATIVEALESVASQTMWAQEKSFEQPTSPRLRRPGKPAKRAKEENGISAEGGGDTSALRSSRASVQTDLSVFEVIVVDDGSTDDTVAVVEKWIAEKTIDCRPQTTDPGEENTPHPSPLPQGARVQSLRALQSPDQLPLPSGERAGVRVSSPQKSMVCGLWSVVSLPVNQGPAKARNQGLQEATGDWIAFLDADDLWLPNHVEVLLAAAHDTSAIMVCGESVRFQDEEKNFEQKLAKSAKPLRQAQGGEEGDLPRRHGEEERENSMLRVFKTGSTLLRQGYEGHAQSEIPATRSGGIPGADDIQQSKLNTPLGSPSKKRCGNFGHGMPSVALAKEGIPWTKYPQHLISRFLSLLPLRLPFIALATEGASVVKSSSRSPRASVQTPDSHLTSHALPPITLQELARHNPIATSAVMVKREALLAAGGFDEQFRGPEDYDLWIRVAAYGHNKEKRFEQKLAKNAKGEIGNACGAKTHAMDFEMKTPAGVAYAPQPPSRSSRASVQNSSDCIMHVAEPVSLYRQATGSLSMDERKFLPQVLRVIEKAYGPGGALEGLPEWKNAALATQYQQASWMAFCRGDRGTAMTHWLKAVRYNVVGPKRIHKPWVRLAYRYVMGRAPAGNE